MEKDGETVTFNFTVLSARKLCRVMLPGRSVDDGFSDGNHVDYVCRWNKIGGEVVKKTNISRMQICVILFFVFIINFTFNLCRS